MRVTQKIILAIVCCFALVAVVPLSVHAQGGIIKEGAHGVQKGVETGAQKTKEGAETVGKGVKDAVTGDDSSDTQRMKRTETNTNTEQEQTTPTTTTTKPSSTTRSKDMSTKSTTTTSSTSSETGRTEGKRLPATAGELPLLAFLGGLALAASALPKIVRQLR